MNWSAGVPAASLHTISAVFGNSTATCDLRMDAGSSVTLNENGFYSSSWGTYFALFSNLRADIRIHAIRVYDRLLTDYERARNHQLDRVRFLGEKASFITQPLRCETYTGVAVEPDPVVVDPVTETRLVKGTDYTVAYADNVRPGAATAVVTGIGDWEGSSATLTFLISFPASYRTVDYIESTGTQVIDTGYLPHPTTRMTADLMFVGSKANRTGAHPGAGFFGCSENAGQCTFSANFGGDSKQDNCIFTWFHKSYLGGQTAAMSVTLDDSQRTSRQTFAINAATTTASYGTKTFNTLKKTTTHTENTLRLFGAMGFDGVVTPFTYYGLRVYGWEIRDGDDLRHNFVPCYRLFDRKGGLLDTMTGRFHENAGRGNFSFSSATHRETLPAEYHPLDYLLATGGQYISTGVTAASDVTVMAEFISAASGTRQSFTRDYWGNAVYVDGVRKTVVGDELATGAEITFLKAGDCVQGAGRLYSAYIWQAGELVRHFEPCYRVADGVAGLYDLVMQVFYPSANAEPFLHGMGGEVGSYWSGGSVSDMGLHCGKGYGALTNFSFSVWVRNPASGSSGDTSGSYGAVVAQGALGGSPGFCCYVYTNNDGKKVLKVQFRETETKRTTLTLDKPEIFEDDKWHHLASTFDYTAGKAYLYLDGKVVDSVTSAAEIVYPVSYGSSCFSIGTRNDNKWNGFPYHGGLAQVTLWNRALTAEEVNLLRVHPVKGTETDLLGAWPLSSGEAGLVDLVSKKPLTVSMGNLGFIMEAVDWFTPGLSILVR